MNTNKICSGRALSSIIPSIILFMIVLLIPIAGLAQAGTVTIIPGKNIQEAIDKAQAGDLIEVQSGTYYGNVNITKPLTLRGVNTGEGQPAVDAQGQGSAITLSANGITLEGFDATNAGGWEEAGILVRSSVNTIRNNTARDNYGLGIYLVKADGNLLINNTAYNNDFGIGLNHSGDNLLKNNTMYDNKGNFLFGYGHNDIDTSNTANGKPIFFLDNESDKVIDSPSNAGCVFCIGCRNITIRDLTLSDCFAGVYLDNTTGSRVENNTLFANTLGISLIDSGNNTLTGNRLRDNVYGIYLKTASINNTLTGNNVTHNDYGIFVNVDEIPGQSNVIYNNILQDNKRSNAFSRGPARWDNGFLGNFYSDFSRPVDGCNDEDGDGICDSPRKIPGGLGLDGYPAIKPNFDVD